MDDGDFHDRFVNDAQIDEIAVSLRASERFEQLNLSGCQLSENSVSVLCDALRNCQRLTSFDVSCNSLEDTDTRTRSVLSMLKTQTVLREIGLDLPNSTVDEFLTVFGSANTSVTSLRIDAVQLSSENNVLMFDFVASNTRLRDLYMLQEFTLSYPMTAAELESIASMLALNSTLTSLMLFGNRRYRDVNNVLIIDKFFPASSAARMLESLQTNYSLLSVSLQGIDVESLLPILDRNENLVWRNMHALILNYCLTLAPLRLPTYVLLWIIDWLPHVYAAVRHIDKIRLIESVQQSIRKLRKQ